MDVLMQFAQAVLDGSVRAVALSQTLRPSTPVIGLPLPSAQTSPFSMTEISRYDERGPAWYWNDLQMGEHTSTISTRRRIGSPAAGCWTACSTGSTRSA